jgi:hypothetical protein
MDVKDTLRVLTEAAERFVNKAPNQKRLEEERAALLDALMQAQLLLSVSATGHRHRTSPPISPKPPKRRRLRLAK